MAVIRVGAISYLNTLPLIWNLDTHPNVRLIYDVPANFLSLLQRNEVDVALLPIIDYQRMDDLVIVPGACISADGHVHTVRLFSKVPIAQITRLYTDTDSHTSVALCRILLKHTYAVEPQLVSGRDDADAQLLIGDKVVCAAPTDHPHQLDLAEAWKDWTGLPFVFAAWMARAGTDLGPLPSLLVEAMQAGLANVNTIVQQDAVPRGWPAPIARQYLKRLLKYPLDLSPRSRQRTAIERFHSLAREMGIIGQCRPLSVYSPPRPDGS